MGYNTEYEGNIKVSPKLHPNDRKILTPVWTTRRMKINMQKLAQELDMDINECQWRYGKEGQFVNTDDIDSKYVVDLNTPPDGQPSLWCDFVIVDDNEEDCSYIQWNGNEKTYCGREWIAYLVNILTEDHYQCNGQLSWRGEDADDVGIINFIDDSFLIVFLKN